MTNGIALALGVVLAAGVAANFMFGWQFEVLLGRILVDVIHWLAFWR